MAQKAKGKAKEMRLGGLSEAGSEIRRWEREMERLYPWVRKDRKRRDKFSYA
jgi:hypothetical protein